MFCWSYIQMRSCSDVFFLKKKLFCFFWVGGGVLSTCDNVRVLQISLFNRLHQIRGFQLWIVMHTRKYSQEFQSQDFRDHLLSFQQSTSFQELVNIACVSTLNNLFFQNKRKSSLSFFFLGFKLAKVVRLNCYFRLIVFLKSLFGILYVCYIQIYFSPLLSYPPFIILGTLWMTF